MRAARIEPLSKGSYVTVDGEVVEFGPIQGSVSSFRTIVMGPHETSISKQHDEHDSGPKS